MDISKVTSESLKNMSDEELHEYVRELIRIGKEKQSGVQAAFLGPDGHTATMAELLEHHSEDEVEDILFNAIKETLKHDGLIYSGKFNHDEIENLFEKQRRGEELTKEEEKLLEVITNQFANDNKDPIAFQKHSLEVLLEILEFSQNEIGYHPNFLDLNIIFNVLTFETLKVNHNFKLPECNKNPGLILSVSKEIGNDILNTWINSLSEEAKNYDKGLVMLGLLHALNKVYSEGIDDMNNVMSIAPANIIRESLGLERMVYDDSEIETENGSNKLDENLKNKLK